MLATVLLALASLWSSYRLHLWFEHSDSCFVVSDHAMVIWGLANTGSPVALFTGLLCCIRALKTGWRHPYVVVAELACSLGLAAAVQGWLT